MKKKIKKNMRRLKGIKNERNYLKEKYKSKKKKK